MNRASLSRSLALFCSPTKHSTPLLRTAWRVVLRTSAYASPLLALDLGRTHATRGRLQCSPSRISGRRSTQLLGQLLPRTHAREHLQVWTTARGERAVAAAVMRRRRRRGRTNRDSQRRRVTMRLQEQQGRETVTGSSSPLLLLYYGAQARAPLADALLRPLAPRPPRPPELLPR